ncbi:MAG: hypothetical protein MPN21_06535 [Thermoanaerobaculia bacterium]|nr:hypothetical protein [Thermoanaerobaculia bacterium]
MTRTQALADTKNESTTDRPGRQEWLARLALLVGSTVFLVAFAELALRLVVPPADPHRGDADRDPFTFFDHHPTLGWDLVPGAEDRHVTAEFDIEIRINEQGLRSDRAYGDAAPPGTRRVVVLGDSFSFGHGVAVEEGWVARLEESSDSLEAVNLAVTGYGIDQMVLRLELRSRDHLAFSPQVVIAAVFLADVFRVTSDAHIGYRKPRFVLAPAAVDGLRLAGVPVSRQAAPSADQRAGSLLLRTVRERGQTLAKHLGRGDAWPITEALLLRLRGRVERGGAKLLVVLVPKDVAVAGRGVRRDLNRRAVARLARMLSELGIPHLDLTDSFTRQLQQTPGEALYFPRDGHWTVAGHRLAGERVAAWIANQGLGLPPEQP